MSQFWYAAPVLAIPPIEKLNSIKRCIRKFLWGNKTAKISYDKLTQNFEKGGLNLQDLENKVKALKCKIIHGLRDLSPFLQASSKFFTEVDVKEWELVNIKSIRNCSKDIWMDIAQTWHEFNYHIPTSKESVLSQSIWQNTHIRILAKNYSKRVRDRLPIIRNLIDTQNNEMYSLAVLNAKYDTQLNFINYYALRNSIPKEWLKIVKKNITVDPQSAKVKINKEIKEMHQNKRNKTTASISKVIYSILIKNKNVNNNNNKIKWETDLNYEIKDSIWEQIFRLTKTLTNCTKLQFLQYRINHRVLVTNSLRHKWDSSISPLCTFCQKSNETILHIFVECEKVVQVWKMLSKWLKHFCFIDFHIKGYDIIFNRYRDSFPKLVNTILLIVKQLYLRYKMSQSGARFSSNYNQNSGVQNVRKSQCHKKQKIG